MDPIRLVIFYVLFAFSLFLTARVVVEMVRTFAREWRPAGGVAVTLETVYTVTDPPVRIGGVGLDLSIIVLWLVVIILMRFADPR